MDDGYTKDELFGVALLTAHEYVEKLKIDDKREFSLTVPPSSAFFSSQPLGGVTRGGGGRSGAIYGHALTLLPLTLQHAALSPLRFWIRSPGVVVVRLTIAIPNVSSHRAPLLFLACEK